MKAPGPLGLEDSLQVLLMHILSCGHPLAPEPGQDWWRHFGCTYRWDLWHQLRSKRQSSRRKRIYWKKKCFRTAVLISFPLLLWEKPFKNGKAQIGMGVAILTQVDTAMLTGLVVSETRPLTQTEIIPYSLGCKCGVRKAELNATANRREGVLSKSNIQYHRLCRYLQPFCCVNMCCKSQCRNALLQ